MIFWIAINVFLSILFTIGLKKLQLVILFQSLFIIYCYSGFTNNEQMNKEKMPLYRTTLLTFIIRNFPAI